MLVCQEDEKVMTLVAQHGTKHWAVISKHLKGRTGKQCRERYYAALFALTFVVSRYGDGTGSTAENSSVFSLICIH